MTQPNVGAVNDPEALEKLLGLVAKAQEVYSHFSQEAVDRIFQHCAIAANQARVTLAEIAVQEAGMGSVEDKTLKNHFASEVIYHAYKNMKTCGVVHHDEEGGYALCAEPVGVLAGIVPCTNPTSTTIFKALLALKTRNAIVISPHPRTVKCTIAAAKLVHDAAVEAGAPENLIGWIDKGSIELCNQLMHNDKVSLILATGAGGLVKAAYSAGKPCMGGGAGNTPVIIDETADIAMAVNSVLLSKTFDNGMICASEQAVVVVRSVADRVKAEFEKRGGYFLKSDDDKEKLARCIFTANGGLVPACVGKTASQLTETAGIQGPPPGCRVLLVELTKIGPEEPLSREKLCPCLGFFVVDDYDAALQTALRLVHFGGMGHTSVLYTDLNGKDKRQRVAKFETVMPTGRALVCMPTSQGGIGGLYNAYQTPSLSLGCGSWGGNTSAEGLQPKHLLNYKQLAERRNAPVIFKVPDTVCFGRSIITEALHPLPEASSTRHVFLITDAKNAKTQAAATVQKLLEDVNMKCTLFTAVTSPVTTEVVEQGVKEVGACHADVIIALGDAYVMDAAKLIRLLTEDPSQSWDYLCTRFLSIANKIVQFSPVGRKIKKLVCIPTTSGAGSEMSPYAVIVYKNKSETVADFSLSPDVALIDYDVVREMSKEDAIESGFEAITNALESLVALTASDYTRNLSVEALDLLFKNFLLSATTADPDSRGECHRAASLAGMACANASVGICEALSHQLVTNFKIPRGLAKAFVLCQAIRFNAEEAPSKLGTLPQYEKPMAKYQYAHAMMKTGLASRQNETAAFEMLVDQLTKLKAELEVPSSLQAYGVEEQAFLDKVDHMASAAFDDQSTGTNPRYPLIAELRHLLLDAYYGRVRTMRFDEVFLATSSK